MTFSLSCRRRRRRRRRGRRRRRRRFSCTQVQCLGRFEDIELRVGNMFLVNYGSSRFFGN